MQARLAPGWTARAGAAASRGDDRTKGVPLNSIDPPKVVAGIAYFVSPATDGAWSSAGAQLHVTYVAKKSRVDPSAGALYPTPAFTVADLTAPALFSLDERRLPKRIRRARA